MTVIALYEAKAHLSALVERVERTGESITITRRGRPAAKLVPIDDESAIELTLALLLASREASTPGEGTLRDLIEDGRRP